ncbi:MAG: sensor histidine kinase [Chthoniobacteraceae bacterium]
MKLDDASQRISKPAVLALALVSVLLIGYFDYIGGWDVSVFVFYAVPILFAVWYGDRYAGFISAAICGVVWFFANQPGNPYSTTQAYVWASANRFAYFVFVAVGGAAMKRQREEMRARIEAMTRARDLEREIVRVSEHEQMRIGQDLHDGLCQNLVAIDCAAACLRSDLEARALPEASAAATIQNLLKNAVIEARNLARGIFPVQMDAEGLPAALEDLVAMTNRLRQTPTRFEVHGRVAVSDPQVSMHLFRIAQEALGNALRHAKAATITLTLSSDGHRLTMIIADDGCGFIADQPHSKGIGLRTMEYRARLIGANLDVESQPDGGTLVRCSLPLNHDSPS